MLGGGAFAKVYSARHKRSGQQFAIKVVDKAFVKRHDKVEMVANERNMLQALAGHPGVVRLYFTFQDSYSLYYVLELAPGGELADQLEQVRTALRRGAVVAAGVGEENGVLREAD